MKITICGHGRIKHNCKDCATKAQTELQQLRNETEASRCFECGFTGYQHMNGCPRSQETAQERTTRKQRRVLPPDPERMNKARAASAEEALFSFMCGKMGENLPGLEKQNLCDLLCNIAHYCDRHGIQLADCLRIARNHYHEETGRAGTQEFCEICSR